QSNLKEADLDDEDDEDEVIVETPGSVQDDLEHSKKLMDDIFSTPAMSKLKSQERPKMPDFLKKDNKTADEDPADELEALLADLPDTDMTEEDLDDDDEVIDMDGQDLS